MKKKIFIIVLVILSVLLLKLISNRIINNILITKYENGEYDATLGKLLTVLNISEPYVAYYNYGNILYNWGEYYAAEEKYKAALAEKPFRNKENSIRINYALAICKQVFVDEQSQDSIKEAIGMYESAVEILVENDTNLYSQKAEQLRKDIQDEIDRLKRLLDSDSSDDSKDSDDENKSEKEVDTIESKIQNIKENAIMEQREIENQFKNYDREYVSKEKKW